MSKWVIFLTQLIEIIKLAFQLQKKIGHKRAKKRLIEVIKEEDDEKTKDLLDDIIYNNDR